MGENKTLVLVNNVKTFRIPGATGLNLANVAAGHFDAYLGIGSELYDYAPGILLVQEAEGQILTFDQKPWTIHDHNFVAANPIITRQLLSLLQQNYQAI